VMMIVTAISVFLYLFFSWLSDRIGRKPVILAGGVLSVLTAFPMFHMLTDAANPAFAAARESAPVTVIADPAECSVQFDPVGQAEFVSSCDIAKSALASRGVSYENEAAPAGARAAIMIGGERLESVDGLAPGAAELARPRAGLHAPLTALLEAH